MPKLANRNQKRVAKKFELRFRIGPKRILLWILILFFGFYFLFSLLPLSSVSEEIPLSQALNDIKEGLVEEIVVEEERIVLKYPDKTLLSTKEKGESMTDLLEKAGVDPSSVELRVKSLSPGRFLTTLLEIGVPILLTLGLFYFLSRQAGKAQDVLFSFGKSRARRFAKGKQKITFADVGGAEGAKKELEEIVDFLKNPKKYRRLGARTPKGVLLLGPSGVGKTLLAKAVAGEANVPFFSMAGSEFMEMLVGVGASVTGDTPVLIRRNGQTKLMPIREFVDQFYQKDETDKVKKIKEVETLGFQKAVNKFWGTQSEKSEKAVFEKSCWQKASGVYRHKVNEIYEIHFLGGKIKTTGDHSIFVRTQGWILAKKVSELKPGDILVNLPMNVRRWDEKRRKTVHKIKKHQFSEYQPLFLDVWGDDPQALEKYEYVMSNPNHLYQYRLAEKVGVCQMTISNWQRGVHLPRSVSKKLVKLNLPAKVEVTPELMKLFGLYTAEGRGATKLEFTFGAHEKNLIIETAKLMNEVFGLEKPVLEATESNTVRVKYYSAHLGRFFARNCGNGSHNKHVPDFIWGLPKRYFLAYLEGYTQGDGYVTGAGKLCASSVSQQLIYELAWLCSMHGIKVGIKHEIVKGGRVIRNEPLPESEAWSLIIGKTSNPFLEKKIKWPHQIKKCYVRKVVKKKFDGFVYDLCGVENEAFFGGEKPILLHNSRVRDLFNTAKRAAPSIIFVDELDAIGGMRGVGIVGGHREQEQTLNQILVEMDGFTPNDHVIILSATNRPDLLDPALTRPGRFDRRIILDMPDINERKKILMIHSKGKPFAKDADWDKVAKRTVGFSGADLENMLNEAAILAARNNKKAIDMDDIEEAATKVKLGPEKKRLQSKQEKKITAYHEAGHAVVAHNLVTIDPVHRVSIVSRGLALGFTLIPPEKEKYTETKTELLEKITALLGGRASEELVFKEFTGGAASDIDQATRIVRKMVIEYGMSNLGPVYFGPQIEKMEWGGAIIKPSELSDKMQAMVDAEIKRMVDQCYGHAFEILKKNRDALDVIAKKLIEQETIEGGEFRALMESMTQSRGERKRALREAKLTRSRKKG